MPSVGTERQGVVVHSNVIQRQHNLFPCVGIEGHTGSFGIAFIIIRWIIFLVIVVIKSVRIHIFAGSCNAFWMYSNKFAGSIKLPNTHMAQSRRSL